MNFTQTHTLTHKSSHSQDYLEFYQRRHHLKYGAIDNYFDIVAVEQVTDEIKTVENDERESVKRKFFFFQKLMHDD